MTGFVKGKQLPIVRKYAQDRCHIPLKARLVALVPQKLLPPEQVIRFTEDDLQNIEHRGVSLRHIVPVGAVEEFDCIRQVGPVQVIAAYLIEDRRFICRYFGQYLQSGSIKIHTDKLHQINKTLLARGPVLINAILLEGGHDVSVASVPRILRHQALQNILFPEKSFDILTDVAVAGHLYIGIDVGQEIVGNVLHFRIADNILDREPCVEFPRVAQLLCQYGLADHNIPGVHVHPHRQMLQEILPNDL